LGGYPGQGGNTVIAGHVDYICCLAVFAPLRNVQEGDVIDYYTGGGEHYQYVVQWFGDFDNTTNWGSVVNGGPNIMTLITCNGTFDPVAHEYNYRRVVRAALAQ
jgi:LPXTG-site transpeptidase (sortase) family protein